MKINFTINGEQREIHTEPMKRMLDILRQDLGLRGAKEGCGEGECGACAVMMNGRLVDSCLIPAIQMTGADILTIEGLGGEAAADALQQAFVDEGAIHCGFCTPGMIMAAHALLARNPHPTEEEIRIGVSGNICRCTGYGKIVRAVERAAKRGCGDSIKPYVSTEVPARPVFEANEKERFFSPVSLAEALDVLAAHDGVKILAGGTDIGPDTHGYINIPYRVMDVFSLPELNGVSLIDGGRRYLRIGACATNADILESPAVHEHLPALAEASARCGAAAIQNRATVGGNIVTASGAGDLPVVLMAMKSSVSVSGKDSIRQMPLDDFITGYRATALGPGELLTEIRIPVPEPGTVQKFYKRGSRKALTLSRVSLAICARCEGGRIAEFSAAAGSMSPVPIRLAGLEAKMPGRELSPGLPLEAAGIAYNDVNPRKSPLYRKTIVANLVRRFFAELLSRVA